MSQEWMLVRDLLENDERDETNIAICDLWIESWQIPRRINEFSWRVRVVEQQNCDMRNEEEKSQILLQIIFLSVTEKKTYEGQPSAP